MLLPGWSTTLPLASTVAPAVLAVVTVCDNDDPEFNVTRYCEPAPWLVTPAGTVVVSVPTARLSNAAVVVPGVTEPEPKPMLTEVGEAPFSCSGPPIVTF